MKIAFLIRSLNYGGAERQLTLLATGLKQQGDDVSVHVFYPGGEFESELKENGVNVNIIGKTGRWDVFRFFFRTIKGIRQEKPEVLHAYMGGANIVSAVIKLFIRPAKIAWGIRSSRMDLSEYDWVHRASARLETFLSRFADSVICNSKTGRDQAVSRGFPAEKTVVVPNGVDLDSFFIDPSRRHELRSKWNIAESDIAIGRVGRLDPVKDYPAFLKAASISARQDPRLRFVCIGPGTRRYLASLRQLAAHLGIEDRVIWAGAIQEMRDAYNALDLLVSSSVSEGFPNVLLEAMACGIPCVTTDAGDAREIVADLGCTVACGDPQALSDACFALLHAKPTAEHIRTSITRRYGPQILVERTKGHLLNLTVPKQGGWLEAVPRESGLNA